MTKANSTYKTLLIFTVLFTLLAVASFAAFQRADESCQAAAQCSQGLPGSKSGDMIWDVFTQRFLSFLIR